MSSPPENLSAQLGEDPLTRLELDWDLETMRIEIVRLGCMLRAAGVEDPGTILDAIQSDVERLIMVRDTAEAHKAAGTLLMASLNRALRKAKANCHFEPIEGEAAWKLHRSEEDEAQWPPWMVPELVLGFMGLASIVAISWFLFVGEAYAWLLGYIALTIGAAVTSTMTKTSTSVPLRVGLSLVVLGTSALGVAGLASAGERKLAIAFGVFFAVLHAATFGLNVWKRSTIERAPAPKG